jgi:hypothetical protein
MKPLVKDTHLIKSWDFSRNKESPGEVTCGSGKKVWWKCEKGHEWEAFIFNRARRKNPSGCPYCDGKRVCHDNCLSTLKLSLAKEWHPTKNGRLTPNDITLKSHKIVWWQCDKGHEWEAIVKDRSSGCGCPFCSGHRVCRDNCLVTINPGLAKEWHPTKNGKLTPNNITIFSNKKVWWVCEKDHEWESAISNRSAGNGCPYCAGQKVCKDNSLATLRPDLSNEWHYIKNGELTPNGITYKSGKKVWWLCDKGHEWKTSLMHRAEGNGCPICSKGPVSKISQKWLDGLNIPVENREVWLKDLKLRVDGFDPQTKTVYEFLGDYWHGNPEIFSAGDINPSNKKSFGQLFEETKEKIQTLEKFGYKVVYIWEKDFKK